MKKVIIILIIVLIILIFAIGGVFAYLYFSTDILKSNKQMYLKYLAESKDMIYNQLKDDDLDAYKKKLKNTPYENNGKIAVSYDIENSNKSEDIKLLENSKIAINGKVDKANKINLQNIKVNYPQSKGIDIDLLAQDDTYGFRINSILKSYIAVENNNLKEWAKLLGFDEEQIKLIPNKIDSNLIDSLISEDEVNQLVEKYTKLVINSLNDDMFSKTNQDKTTMYSLKINETQLRDLEKVVIETAKDDESIWQIIRRIYVNFSIYPGEEVDKQIDEMKKDLEETINDGSEADTDLYGYTTTDTSKEDKIYVFNIYVEGNELIKIESINDDQLQTVSKTQNGILIEKKEKDYSDKEDITTMTIEKKKEEDKLIYNIEMTNNSEILCSLAIGYKGLNTLNKVEEVASFNFNLYDELSYGIFKNAEDDIKTPSRKFKYSNTNTFNENLDIKRIENNEIWKMNGKDAKQIGNVFENIATKMKETNKGQIQNNVSSYENKSKADIITLGLIPYFSIVGIDNIEYEQITTRNVAVAYAGGIVGLINARNITFYSYLLNAVNNTSLEQEVNRINR